MKSLSKITKVVILAVVAAILIVVVIVYSRPSDTSQDASNAASTTLTANSPAQTPTSSATAAQTTATKKSGKPPVSVPIVNSPAAPVISIITPVGNDVWKIGTQDVISWSKAGGISGSISLIDASNQKFVGIILPEVGPNQTSYTWNTLSVSLNRTDPSGEDVTPGLYEIELMYDGNNVKPATSFPFSIIN